jgi:hypothetical protein
MLLMSCSALVRQGKLGLEMDSHLRGNDSISINPMIDKCRVIPANAGIPLIERHGFPQAQE